MDPEVFSREELAAAAGVPEERIESLEGEGLLAPSGLTAGEVPFYRADKIVEIGKVIQLLDMGYQPAEVKKIVERVGVPGAVRGKKSKGTYFTVGELAEKTGVGVRTLKHWEDKGLIAPDTRSEGGFRLYQESYTFIVQLIRDLQLFGFKLEEIKEVTDLFRLFTSMREGRSGLALEEMLERLDEMGQKIKALRKHTEQLKEGIRRWEKLLDERRKDVSRFKEKLRRTLQEKERKTARPGTRRKPPSRSSPGAAPTPPPEEETS